MRRAETSMRRSPSRRAFWITAFPGDPVVTRYCANATSPLAGTGTVTRLDAASAAHQHRQRNEQRHGSEPARHLPRLTALACAALVLVDHAVDEVVRLGLIGAHEVVALGVLRDLLEVLLRVLREDLVQAAAHVDDLLGVNLDVRGLALEGRAHLVDQ